MAQPLIPPLKLSDFDIPPRQPYFTTEFKKDLADLDGPTVDLADAQKAVGIVDLVAIALTLDAPLSALDQGLAFEDTDTSAAAVDTIIHGSSLIEGSFPTTETTIGAATKEGGKLNLVIPPIAGTGSGAKVTPAPAPAPKIPPVGAGISGPPLAGAHAFITNIARPGAPGRFRVGDPWQITIKAPAGSTIYAVASHNGVHIGQSPFGKVPANGIMLLNGTFTADQRGAWQENWYSDSHFINQIVFAVE